MTENSKQILPSDAEKQKVEIVSVLERVLTDLDRLELTVPAIRIAEAIHSLKSS